MYNLLLRDPTKEYLRWKEDICDYIDGTWEYFKPGKPRTPTWQNTIASCLSTQNKLFQSGTEKYKQPGYWTLKVLEPPSSSQRKGGPATAGSSSTGKTKSVTQQASEKERKRKIIPTPKKQKTQIAESSEDEAFQPSVWKRHSLKRSREKDAKSLEVTGKRKRRSIDYATMTRLSPSTSPEPKTPSRPPKPRPHPINRPPRPVLSVPKTPPPGGRYEPTVIEFSEAESEDASSSSGGDVFGSSGSELSVHSSIPSSDSDGSGDEMGTAVTGNVKEARGSPIKEEGEQEKPKVVAAPDGTELPPVPEVKEEQTPSEPIRTEIVSEAQVVPTTPGMGPASDTRPGEVELPKSVNLVGSPELATAGEAAVPHASNIAEPNASPQPFKTEDGVASTAPNGELKEDDRNAVDTEGASHVTSSENQKQKSFRPPRPSGPQYTFLTAEEEFTLLQRLESYRQCPPSAARLRRKLHLRRLKRALGLGVFDLDAAVSRSLRENRPYPVPMPPVKMPPAVTLADGRVVPLKVAGMEHQKMLDRFKAVASITSTPYEHSFLSRLHGDPFLADTLTTPRPFVSPYTGKLLKPYIWRDYEARPPRKITLETIQSRGFLYDPEWTRPQSAPIDYVYFQRMHVEQVNQALCRAFWPDIDVSENLQWPDFSIVALYRRSVIGCAFMTPEGYITYIMVRPGWTGAGVGRFMLYHLIQAASGKDVTLHVSANNKAMLLYQRMGFKPEEFIVGFYDKYLPADSKECKNAFFVRLRR
ncbi:Cysteine-rich protein 2-binding protein [Borealophlyctis nickersoniae]|nr:Cysteine-rich protein 2-binding protein [Borealophlyctis nickersoniae]